MQALSQIPLRISFASGLPLRCVTMRDMDLAHLQAFNDQVVALARAGIPLGRGLRQSAADVRGPSAEWMERVGTAIEQGASLVEVLQREPGWFPPAYAAVLSVGARTGNLALAAESMATTLRHLQEVRRLIGTALIYPLVVVAMAVLLFVMVLRHAYGPLLNTLQAQRVLLVESGGVAPWEAWMRVAQRGGGGWLALGFVILMAGMAAIWYSARARRLARGPRAVTLLWVPGSRPLLRASQMATFCEVLGQLLRHAISLPVALRLSSEAAGGTSLQGDAHALASAIESGSCAAWQGSSRDGLPAYVAWLVRGGSSSASVPDSLFALAAEERRRVRGWADWLRSVFPGLALVTVGGSATVLYVLSFMGPWLEVMARMAAQIHGKY